MPIADIWRTPLTTTVEPSQSSGLGSGSSHCLGPIGRLLIGRRANFHRSMVNGGRPIPDLLALANLLHFQLSTFWLATTASGLLAGSLFYIADPASMHVFPATAPMEEAIAFAGTLHHNFNWLIVVFAMITICAGFIELSMHPIRTD